MASSRPRKLFTIERSARAKSGDSKSKDAPAQHDYAAEDRHNEILEAIATLRGDISKLGTVEAEETSEAAPEQSAVDPDFFKQQIIEAEKLRSELQELSDAIERTKSEIAALRKAPNDPTDKLSSAAAGLRAVVSDTEAATDGIIEAAEAIEELGERIGAQGSDATKQLADELGEKVTAIFEHCNFQDITGQRITKVVQTMEFIDERVARMMEIWGGDSAFEGVVPDAEVDETPIGERLDGPAATPEQKISQDDIDKLFD